VWWKLLIGLSISLVEALLVKLVVELPKHLGFLVVFVILCLLHQI